MLTYALDKRGTQSLYEYLYGCIKNDIVRGTLAAGTRLPSKRAFAQQLGVSVITVENAYEQLVAEGYLEVKPRKGFFVAALAEIPLESQQSAMQLHQHASFAPSKGVNVDNNAENENRAIIADFSNNQTDPESFPFATWSKLMRATMTERPSDLLHKSPTGGVFELRKALAEHLYNYRAMSVSPEQIIVGAGSEYLHGLLVNLFGQEKRYAVENPGYLKVAATYQAHGASCTFAPIDSAGVLPDALTACKADVAHISPTHHFPTGITMPVSRRYELLSWAAQAPDRYLIEDDYDSEFRLKGRPIPALQSIDISERVIYLNTFTKSLASTIRVSYMVLPPHLVERFNERLGFLSNTVSNFEQYTLATFLSEGYFERHISRLRHRYQKRRDYLLGALAASDFSSLVTISEEDAGLHFLLHVAPSLDPLALKECALKRGVKLANLNEYEHVQSAKRVPSQTFVMNYSSLQDAQIEEGLLALGAAIKEVQARG